MLGIDDVLVIFVMAILVEAGSEVFAEWIVDLLDWHIVPSVPIQPAPPLLVHASSGGEQNAAWCGQLVDRLGANADALSAKIGATAVWSEQLIGTLGSSLV